MKTEVVSLPQNGVVVVVVVVSVVDVVSVVVVVVLDAIVMM